MAIRLITGRLQQGSRYCAKQQRFGPPAGTFIRLNDKETRTDQDIYTREAHI